MIGLLEIIAGELVTGVTRFIAVSVKTFVLCLGTRCVINLGDGMSQPPGALNICEHDMNFPRPTPPALA